MKPILFNIYNIYIVILFYAKFSVQAKLEAYITDEQQCSPSEISSSCASEQFISTSLRVGSKIHFLVENHLSDS